MPMLLRTMGEIMREAGRDALFVQFGDPFKPSTEAEAAKAQHLEWFAGRGIDYEHTAPDDWLEGNCNLFAVHFSGPDDPRVAEYSTIFEDADGRSLDPKAYQLFIYCYEAWRERADDDARVNESRQDDPNAGS